MEFSVRADINRMHTPQDAIDDAWAAVAEGDIQAAEKAPDASETAASSVYQIGPCTRMYPVASVTGGLWEHSLEQDPFVDAWAMAAMAEAKV